MLKKLYEIPESELFILGLEEGFLINSPGVPGGAGGPDPIVDDEEDLE